MGLRDVSQGAGQEGSFRARVYTLLTMALLLLVLIEQLNQHQRIRPRFSFLRIPFIRGFPKPACGVGGCARARVIKEQRNVKRYNTDIPDPASPLHLAFDLPVVENESDSPGLPYQ